MRKGQLGKAIFPHARLVGQLGELLRAAEKNFSRTRLAADMAGGYAQVRIPAKIAIKAAMARISSYPRSSFLSMYEGRSARMAHLPSKGNVVTAGINATFVLTYSTFDEHRRLPAAGAAIGRRNGERLTLIGSEMSAVFHRVPDAISHAQTLADAGLLVDDRKPRPAGFITRT